MNSIEKAVRRLMSGGEADKQKVVASAVSSLDASVNFDSGNNLNKHICRIDYEKLKQFGFLIPNSPEGRLAEQYRVLKRPILMNAFKENFPQLERPNSVMVTSSLEGEGKTYTSLNLALSISMERNNTVLLVDSDVIKTSISKILGLENNLGSIHCDFTVIGETSYLPPLGRAIIVGEKGHLGITVVTNGIQCHSSMPSLGKNAIEMMSEIMSHIHKMDEYMPVINPPMTLDKLKSELSAVFPDKEIFEKILGEQKVLNELLVALTNYTKNFTLIEAGVKENVIPDTCEANIDFRLLPGHTAEMIVQALTKMIEEDLGYEVRDIPIGNPEDVFVYLNVGYETEASYWEEWEKSQFIREFAKVAETVYGHKMIYFLSPGGSDACFYRNKDYCKETIQFGPGRFSLVHATNEYIDLQDFKDAIKVYTLFAYNFLK